MPEGLDRFVAAQDPVWPQVVAELAAGRKRSHWIWYVFPQLAGLGESAMSVRYALASRPEAAHQGLKVRFSRPRRQRSSGQTRQCEASRHLQATCLDLRQNARRSVAALQRLDDRRLEDVGIARNHLPQVAMQLFR